jgi:hypothetical protein
VHLFCFSNKKESLFQYLDYINEVGYFQPILAIAHEKYHLANFTNENGL